MEQNPAIQLILDEIRKIRQTQKISQEDMGQYLGISQAAYNKIENGNTTLKYDVLFAISKRLEVPIEQFYKIADTSQISNTFKNA